MDTLIPVDSTNITPDVLQEPQEENQHENIELAITQESDNEATDIDFDETDTDYEISEYMGKLLSSKGKDLYSNATFAGPVISLKTKPTQLTGSWSPFRSKLNNFTKGCKWSPDGSCILTNSDDQSLRLFDLPSPVTNYATNGTEIDFANFQELGTSLEVKEAGLVYDYAWYPLMSSLDPVTSCFISTSKDQPIHLWDAFTGSLRSTYKPYDHLDEVVAAYSLAFDPHGQHIYSGFNKTIRIFDVTVPGRDFREIVTKSKREGQSGIISCLAVNPANHRIIGAGSYCKTLGIYLEPRGDRLCILAGQSGGLTQLMFSPDGNKLYTGGRKDPEILCWDIRNPGKIIYSLRRSVTTNQRMYFDISKDGAFIVSGNSNGVVTIWDATTPAKEVPGFDEPILDPSLYFQGHDDCVNGTSFHPYVPLVATSSGQRKFPKPLASESDSDDEEKEKEDNSLRFWWFN